jgi:hypothetical protein
MEALGRLAMREKEPQAGGCSFDPETPILMADGNSKPIKDVRVGDQVKAADPSNGTALDKPITALHNNYDNDLLDLTIADHSGERSVIHTTQNHLFWDATTKQWTGAGRLRRGDKLLSEKGRDAHVVASWPLTRARTMLNLTVADLHTYYVLAGNTPVLVHNIPCERLSAPNPVPAAIRKSYENIRGASGQQRFNDDGTPDIFTATHGEPLSVQRQWGGSTVWEVPGARNPSKTRILVNPRGQMGYTTNHYVSIQEFSAPHYPDWGW